MTSTSSPNKPQVSFPLKSTINSQTKPSFDIDNFNIQDEDTSGNLDHPFIGRKTGTTLNSATLLKTTLKLRNENFELKQELEKANNFRQISELEIKKLRNNIAELERKNEELDKNLRAQRSEIITLKKQSEIVSGGADLKKMIEDDFENFFEMEFKGNEKNFEDISEHLDDDEPKAIKPAKKAPYKKWTRNVNLYGKYIAFLNLDNKSKDERIETLEYELKQAKKEIQQQFLEHQSRLIQGSATTDAQKDAIFKNLPLPGAQFDSLEPKKKSIAYDDMAALMITYKEELKSMFNSLDNQSTHYEKQLFNSKESSKKEVKYLKEQINVLKKRKDHEELYKASIKKVQELEFEIKALTEHFEKMLDSHDLKVEEYKEDIKELKRRDVEMVHNVGELQNEIKIKTKRINQLELKFKRSKKFLDMIDEEREELLKLRASMDPAKLAKFDAARNAKRDLSSTQESMDRPKSRDFRVRRGKSAAKKIQENRIANLQETNHGGIKVLPHGSVDNRDDIQEKINNKRKKYEEPEFYNLLDELKRLDELGQVRGMLQMIKDILAGEFDETQEDEQDELEKLLPNSKLLALKKKTKKKKKKWNQTSDELKQQAIAILASYPPIFPNLTPTALISVAIHDYLFDFVDSFSLSALSKLNKDGTENIYNKLLPQALTSLGQIVFHASSFPFTNPQAHADKDFPKICQFLTHFLFEKETKKLGFLKFLFTCVKNRFYDYEFLGDFKLFGTLLKLLDDGDMNEKIMVAKILEIDTEFEREVWRNTGGVSLDQSTLRGKRSGYGAKMKGNRRQDSDSDLSSSRSSIKHSNSGRGLSESVFAGNTIDARKIQDLVDGVVNCLCRFREIQLVRSLLRILDYISEIKGSASLVYSPKLRERLLYLCSKPLSGDITRTALKLLNLFGEKGESDNTQDKNLVRIVDNMKNLLKDPNLPNTNYNSYKSIFDLLEFLIKNKNLPQHQLQMINLINVFLESSADSLDEKDIIQILKANGEFHKRNPKLWESRVDKGFMLIYALNQLTKGKELDSKIRRLCLRILEILIPIYKKSETLNDDIIRMLTMVHDPENLGSEDSFSPYKLPLDQCLSLLRIFLPNVDNCGMLLQHDHFFNICKHNILYSQEMRPKMAFLMALLCNTVTKRNQAELQREKQNEDLIESGRESQIKLSSNLNLKKKLRSLALSKKHKPMILAIIESIENAHDDIQVKTNLIFFLKTVLVNQPLSVFENLFSTQTPKEKLREMMEESPSDEIKDLFSILYSQIVREYGEKDLNTQKGDDGDSEIEDHDDAISSQEDVGDDNSSWNYDDDEKEKDKDMEMKDADMPLNSQEGVFQDLDNIFSKEQTSEYTSTYSASVNPSKSRK